MLDLVRVYPSVWVLFAVFLGLQIATSVFLTLAAVKDPATIPMRSFLYRAYLNPADKPQIETRRKYLDVINGRL